MHHLSFWFLRVQGILAGVSTEHLLLAGCPGNHPTPAFFIWRLRVRGVIFILSIRHPPLVMNRSGNAWVFGRISICLGSQASSLDSRKAIHLLSCMFNITLLLRHPPRSHLFCTLHQVAPCDLCLMCCSPCLSAFEVQRPSKIPLQSLHCVLTVVVSVTTPSQDTWNRDLRV